MKSAKESDSFTEFLADALKIIMSENDDYVFIKDINSVYLSGSKHMLELAGLKSDEEFFGKTDYDIFPKELADKYVSDDKRIFESRQPMLGVLERISAEEGKERWIKTWKRPIYDKEGKVIGVYGIGRDVTTQINLENQVKDQAVFSDLISKIPFGVGIIHEFDGKYYLDFANDGWYSVNHFSKKTGDQYFGKNILNGISSEDGARIIDEFKRITGHPDQTGDVSYRVTGDDGLPHYIDLRFRFSYEKDGMAYYYSSYADLDELKKTEERLEESIGVLNEAISNSDIQFFTYYPDKHHGEIYAVNSRLSELPTSWNNFPDSFLKYTQASEEDAASYRAMIKEIDNGADSSGCLVRLAYKGVFTWEKLTIKAVKNKEGKTIRGQGYSINVTERKKAEERLNEEKIRQKNLGGNVFESFSFDLTKNSNPSVKTSDTKMLESEVSESLVKEAIRLCPPLANTNPATREILLKAAARIPGKKDRETFITTCSGYAVRTAMSKGIYTGTIRYRRYVGSLLRWVSTEIEVIQEPDSRDFIAFYYTKDINDQVVQEKIVSEALTRTYLSILYVDLQTEVVQGQEENSTTDTSLNGLKYDNALQTVEKGLAGDKDAIEEFQKAMDLKEIKAELEKKATYTVFFALKNPDDALPGAKQKRLKCDIYYLDKFKNVIVFMTYDVTAIVEAEKENRDKLETALAAAEQASVAKTEFLSRMSHEIRTPMNAIIGLDAIALQEKDLTPTMEDHLQKIGISARFLLSLINDILDMSRIESGRMALKSEKFDFEEMIDGINTILYQQCKDCGLDYECILKSFTEPCYIGDVTKLQQVLVNILGNAVKFTPKGGKVTMSIEQISRSADKATLRFEISDTGIGIDEKFLPNLFQPFSQENRGKTSAYGGTGLGLAISKSIVNLMNGDITVHSIKNVGSEFTVEVEVGLSDETIRRRKTLNLPLKNLYTLIVDDDIVICQHTKIILDDSGFKSEWAVSGADAVEKVIAQHKASKDYDLILLDWKMPDMDGIETAREIRKIVGPDVTIIIMTAYDWADIEKKAFDAGVDMFMRKPLFASSVTKTYEEVINRKNKGKTLEESQPDFDFSGKRVLLVEDNEINAEIAKSLLEMKNLQVELASNGAEAVESFASAQEGYYDVILMDVRMPVMDGLEATRTIRAMRKKQAKTIPIIAMTANAFQEDINQSLEAGMNAHLAKPIEPYLMYQVLNRFLSAPKKK
jgi:two-component system sensor histidine kinase/response regulator